jgi:hypothetical protein
MFDTIFDATIAINTQPKIEGRRPFDGSLIMKKMAAEATRISSLNVMKMFTHHDV